MHPDKNCKFLSPCLLLLTFAMLPLFCEQAFSLDGVGRTAKQGLMMSVSCLLVYPVSKSFMTIRDCSSRRANPVSFPLYFFIISNISISLGKFFTSHFLPSNVFLYHPGRYVFLLFLYWEYFMGQCLIISLWFPHATFQHV